MKLKNRQGQALILACMMMLPFLKAGATTTSTPGVTAATYSEVTLQKGSITDNVIATGSLRYDKEESLTLPEAVTLKSIEVEAGESVTKEQILAQYDLDALEESLKEAQDALLIQDETIDKLLTGQSSDQSIKSSIAGVVKILNLSAGQSVQQTLQDQPAAIISANGLMEVSITPSQPLVLGQEMKIKVGTLTQTGSVARLDADDSALITFPDSKAEVGELVYVTFNNFAIGEGKAQINLPYQLYSQIDGVVDSVSVNVNSSIRKNSTIYQIKDTAPTAEYLQALEDREELLQTIGQYKQLIADPVFLSVQDGVVAKVSAQEKMPLKKGDEMLSLYVDNSYVLDVTVDELDILSVQTGQEGTAALDAITGAQLSVQVEKIYLLGTSSSGITNYKVTLSIKGDERLRSGMNGTITLTVGEVSNSVLVPLAALMSDRSGNYVLLKGNGEAASTESQGVKTYVEVGLSDASYAAVIGGLSEGDIVLVRSSALTNTQRTTQIQPGLGLTNQKLPSNPDNSGNPGGGRRQ